MIKHDMYELREEYNIKRVRPSKKSVKPYQKKKKKKKRVWTHQSIKWVIFIFHCHFLSWINNCEMVLIFYTDKRIICQTKKIEYSFQKKKKNCVSYLWTLDHSHIFDWKSCHLIYIMYFFSKKEITSCTS